MARNFDIEALYNQTLKAIDRVARRFADNKALIVTESDMKCQLYAEFRTFLSEDEETFENFITGSPLHTEIAFYNPNERNRADMPVDIVIMDTEQFSILKDPRFRLEDGKITNGLPGKQYRALGDCILIELKFNKLKSGITESFKNSIVKDIQKLETIISYNSDNRMKGISLIFNKTDEFCQSFIEDVLQFESESVDIIYRTSGLIFG